MKLENIKKNWKKTKKCASKYFSVGVVRAMSLAEAKCRGHLVWKLQRDMIRLDLTFSISRIKQTFTSQIVKQVGSKIEFSISPSYTLLK